MPALELAEIPAPHIVAYGASLLGRRTAVDHWHGESIN